MERLMARDSQDVPAAAVLPDWLLDWQQEGVSTHSAIWRFDGLRPVTAEDLLGHWLGSELPTDHPLDGILTALGWHGKAFFVPDAAHPLLFGDGAGGVTPLDPVRLPVRLALRLPWLARSRLARRLFSGIRRLAVSDPPAAHIEVLPFHGKSSAAMVYDRLPVTDHFRRIDERRLLGLMEMPGMERPFFFMLEHEGS